MLVLVLTPFVRQVGHTGPLGSWRCSYCERVEFSYAKIKIHAAVEHGVRPVTKEQARWLESTRS